MRLIQRLLVAGAAAAALGGTPAQSLGPSELEKILTHTPRGALVRDYLNGSDATQMNVHVPCESVDAYLRTVTQFPDDRGKFRNIARAIVANHVDIQISDGRFTITAPHDYSFQYPIQIGIIEMTVTDTLSGRYVASERFQYKGQWQWGYAFILDEGSQFRLEMNGGTKKKAGIIKLFDSRAELPKTHEAEAMITFSDYFALYDITNGTVTRYDIRDLDNNAYEEADLPEGVRQPFRRLETQLMQQATKRTK
ncbi:MAG: hypothetical protein ABIH41_04095 [Nanoarchaeota archaeon]